MKSPVFPCISLACVLSAKLAFGQDVAPAAPVATPPQDSTAAAPAAPPAPKSPLTQWGTDFSFLFDGYVDWNYNNPASGFNGLQNFDFRADTAHVNLGKITIDRAPAPIGFHVDVGFGETLDAIHAADRDPNAWKYFQQAYIDLKPKSWHGLEIDAGQFVTSAGAEVIETNQNWNYSRSLLFAWAIPYYHFGLRASMPIGAHFTAGVQLVNGWNNVEPLNGGKTVGLNGAYAWKKVTWTNNYYVGPEKPHTTVGLRNLFDTVIQVNATDKFSYYINGDYGRDKNVGPGASVWAGVAVAARYAIGKKYAIASRLEYFDDRNGFSTGTAQHVEEFTLTGEYKMNGWLMSRLEFRNDWSDQPFFETNKPGGGSKTQPTVLLGLIAYVAPHK
jgi:hypothetical protein